MRTLSQMLENRRRKFRAYSFSSLLKFLNAEARRSGYKSFKDFTLKEISHAPRTFTRRLRAGKLKPIEVDVIYEKLDVTPENLKRRGEADNWRAKARTFRDEKQNDESLDPEDFESLIA